MDGPARLNSTASDTMATGLSSTCLPGLCGRRGEDRAAKLSDHIGELGEIYLEYLLCDILS